MPPGRGRAQRGGNAHPGWNSRGAAIPAFYSTTFSANEAVLSEGGVWRKQISFFSDVATTGGVAYGTQPLSDRGEPNHYNDSYALLSPSKVLVGPNQRVEIVVSIPGSIDGDCSHEVEMWLRGNDDGIGGAITPQVYEGIVGIGYSEIVRWEGTTRDVDNFTYLAGPGGNDSSPANGDRYEFKVIGNTFTISKWNGSIFVPVVSASDTSVSGHAKYQTGQPGIGLYRGVDGCGASQQDYAITSFTAETL